jgi:hypothetical protein
VGEPMADLCQRVRVNKMESIAVGAQTVPYVCNRPVTVVVADQDGTEHPLCDECGPEVTAEADTARCRQWSETVHGWAQEVAHRPELANWLTQFAVELAGPDDGK